MINLHNLPYITIVSHTLGTCMAGLMSAFSRQCSGSASVHEQMQALDCGCAGDVCRSQLEQLDKLLNEVQEVVKLGRLNTYGGDLASLKKYTDLDIDKLQSEGCTPQLILFLHGNEKDAEEDYKRYCSVKKSVMQTQM